MQGPGTPGLEWSRVDMTQLHQKAEHLCSRFLSNYSSTTPIVTLWKEFRPYVMNVLR